MPGIATRPPRRAVAGFLLLCALAGWSAAASADPTPRGPRTAGLLPLRPSRSTEIPARTRLNARVYANRWQSVDKLNLLRGVQPQSPRLRARLQAAGARALNTGPFSAANPETLRICALRVDFTRDSTGTQTTGDGRFMAVRDTNDLVDPGPHHRAYFEAHLAALARYYKAQSYGSMVLLYDVYPREDTAAYHLRDMSDYGPWTLSQAVVKDATNLVHDTFARADSGTDIIPWSQYDRVILFHAGADFQSDVRSDSPFDIPTFTLGFADSTIVKVHDRTNGREVQWDAASVLPEMASQDGLISAINGGLAHEFGLLLGSRGRQGVPDLYNVESGLPVLGTWSIMDSGNLLGVRLGADSNQIYALGVVPGPHDIWSKIILFPDVMLPPGPGPGTFVYSADSTFQLRDSENNPDYGFVSLTQDEYLLLENRQTDPDSTLGDLRLQTDPATGVALGTARVRVAGNDTTVTQTNEYDVLQPGSGVLCIHVDNSVVDYTEVNATPDGSPNTNPRRPGIAVLQADGSGSLGDPTSVYFDGGPFDPFYVGNLNDSLYEDQRPSSRGNSGGETHVTFRVLDPPQNTMTVRLHRLRTRYGWPALDPVYFPQGAAAAADLDGDGLDEYYAAADTAEIFGHAWNGDPLKGVDGHGRPLPFVSVRGAWDPELMSMPGWGPTGRDVLLAVLQDNPIVTNGDPYQRQSAVHGGKLYAFTSGPGLLPGYPLAPEVTTPLMRVGDAVLFGSTNGTVWMAGAHGAAPLRGFPGSAYGPVVGRMALAQFGAQKLGLAVATLGSNQVRFLPMFPDTSGLDTLAAVSTVALSPPGGVLHNPTLLAAYAFPGDSASGRGVTLFVVDSTGWMDAIHSDGTHLPGFPYSLPQPVAGPATLGSLSSDGRPAILLQCLDGNLDAVGTDGRPLHGFPVLLPSGKAPVPSSSPFEYRDANGAAVVVVPTSSGDLAAADSVGKPVVGFPWALAANWGTGATLVRDYANPASPLLLTVGGYGGWSLDSLPGVRWGSVVSRGAGVDAGRTGFLSPQHVAAAKAPASYADLDNFRVFPNPLRLSQLNEVRVRFDLSKDASVRMRLYDLAGRIVAESRWPGHAAVNTVAIPAENLGSGLYHVEAVVEGGGARKILPVAVIR